MSLSQPDRFQVPAPFWRAVTQFGLEPAAVLREARLPATLLGPQGVVTTTQYFALWQALERIAAQPGVALDFIARLDTAVLPVAFLNAYYARDLRDGLRRSARFRQLYTPHEMTVEETGEECRIGIEWPHTHERAPLMLTDAVFGGLMELARRGTGTAITPRRVELVYAPPAADAHARYFGCPVLFRQPRNLLVLQRADLDRRFPGHNPELLELLTPALESALEARVRQRTLREQIRAVLRRVLPGGRPDIAAVARELGTSARTLQRRITAEGATFRDLLQDSRRELARQLLRDPRTNIGDVAHLLGFEDSNSFYRAFRSWEGTTPAQWRERHGGGQPP